MKDDPRGTSPLPSQVRHAPARRPWRSAIVLAAVLSLTACGAGSGDRARGPAAQAKVAPPGIPAALQTELESWLAGHGRPPADYVAGLFDEHDVVLLGEQHRIRHDVLLVQDLLPRLHAAGIRTLAIEYARRADQALVDSVVNAPTWNEAIAREVFFRGFMPWGFREYVDLLKAAWRVNRERAPGTPAFRVLGVNNSPDHSLFRSEADWNDPEVRRRVDHGEIEADWARPVLEAVGRGEKVLGYCGIHHAFSGFRQPRVEKGAFAGPGQDRFGNRLREVLGTRVATVFLHAPWQDSTGYGVTFVHPADGRLDAFMLARSGGPFAVGFDIAPSPLANLSIANAVYRHGHEPFTLAQFCDGWIYTRPVGEFEPVTYIDGWIHAGNLDRARATAMNPQWRGQSVEQLNAGCRTYLDDFRRFFGRLQ